MLRYLISFLCGFACCAALVFVYWHWRLEQVDLDNTSTVINAPTPSKAPQSTDEPVSAELTVGERISTLRSELERDPVNAAQWLSLHDLYLLAGNLNAAIEALLNYSHYELDVVRIDSALSGFKLHLLAMVEAVLIDPEVTDPAEFDRLINHVESLLTVMPVDAELHWQLAQLFQKRGDTSQADYHRLLAANDPRFAIGVEERGSGSKETGSQERSSDIPVESEFVIPLRRRQNHYMADVSVSGQSASLMLDTGASLSGVTQEFANRHRNVIATTRTVLLNTAAGPATGELFTSKTVELGELVFRDHSMVVFPVAEESGFDGVLGLDILGQFDFYIDQNTPALHLRYFGTEPRP